MNEKTATANKGWIVVFAGLAINLILGVLYAWGVIAKALGDPVGTGRKHRPRCRSRWPRFVLPS